MEEERGEVKGVVVRASGIFGGRIYGRGEGRGDGRSGITGACRDRHVGLRGLCNGADRSV